MKKCITIFALCLALLFPATVHAAETTPSNDKLVTVESSSRTTYYESTWLNNSSSGRFPIYCGNSGSVGVTFKVESSSTSSWAMIQLLDANGNAKTQLVYVDPTTNGGDGYYTHINIPAGTYYVTFNASTNVGMRIMCWMY